MTKILRVVGLPLAKGRDGSRAVQAGLGWRGLGRWATAHTVWVRGNGGGGGGSARLAKRGLDRWGECRKNTGSCTIMQCR